MNKKTLTQDIFLLIASVFGALMLGAIIFTCTEGWSIMDSFYFVTMTATTVGYGDFTPTTELSKFFTIIFSLSIIPFVLYTFSFVAKAQIEGVYKKIHHIERQQREQEEELDEAESKLKRQKSLLLEQEKELRKQKTKLKREAKINALQANKITKQEKELEVVEDVVEKVLE